MYCDAFLDPNFWRAPNFLFLDPNLLFLNPNIKIDINSTYLLAYTFVFLDKNQYSNVENEFKSKMNLKMSGMDLIT